jgi:raffinose/stachyose/melibiose transport system permease protein
VAIVVLPSIQGMELSLFDWDGLSPEKTFVGINNFVGLLRDPLGSGAVVRTIVIALALLIVQNLFGMLLALALNSRIRSRNILRTVFFAPAVLSSVVLGFTFRYIFAPQGTLNQILSTLGMDWLQQNWLGNPTYAVGTIILVIAWQSVGATMVVYLAGLQGVPAELIEAATMDGASGLRRFYSVVLPQLAPAITINLMLTLINGLRVFDQVYVLTNGGPADSTQTISTLLVQQAFQFSHFGYASAIAVVLASIVAVLSSIQYYFLRRQRTA